MKKNLSLKILAVVIACIIWVQVNLLKEQSIVMTIPLIVVDLPDNIFVDKNEVYKLKFQINGSGMDLLSFYISNPAIEYDGSSLKVGSNKLSAENLVPYFRKYENIRFVPIDEIERTSIYTERVIQRKVGVLITYESEEAKAYFEASNLELNENSVIVSGPIEDVQKIDIVVTQPISIAMIKGKKKIKPSVSSNKVLYIPEHFSLVEQNQIIAKKTFSNIPIEIYDKEVSFFPNTVTVILEGNKDYIEAVKTKDIKAKIKKSNGKVEITVNKYQSLKVVDYSPKKAMINKKAKK
ncbi:MAG TPA: hypothetical protein PLH63_02855 [Candidatus Cloacimonadota bacterium]|nr:hypothetical protein [Candidatus Cloacimonadota bacterium]